MFGLIVPVLYIFLITMSVGFLLMDRAPIEILTVSYFFYFVLAFSVVTVCILKIMKKCLGAVPDFWNKQY